MQVKLYNSLIIFQIHEITQCHLDKGDMQLF